MIKMIKNDLATDTDYWAPNLITIANISAEYLLIFSWTLRHSRLPVVLMEMPQLKVEAATNHMLSMG